MNHLNDLYNAVYSLPRLGLRGHSPKLSFPIAMIKDGDTYLGFMVYFFGEDIPDAFAFVNTTSEEPKFYQNGELVREFGIPLAEAIRSKPDDAPCEELPENILQLFSEAAFNGSFCVDGYNRYLEQVMRCVSPGKRKFYHLFIIGGEQA